MSKHGDIPESRRLNARSLALSALLGTHPPRLSARALVALAELFGINGGTMRTALSRMVTAGDVDVDAGTYTLAARLQQRQAAQDAGRSTVAAAWDGTWHTAIAIADQRDLSDRRQVRSLMANARFGELRPTVWMRPANLPALALDSGWVIVTGEPTGADDHALLEQLWDLTAIADRARTLDRRLAEAAGALDRSDPNDIPAAFVLSATVVRFLRSEPLLPAELEPPDWPIRGLRRRYDGYEADLQAMMRPFLVAHDA
jgi:phenylacetic acid degradation operon negative regulatory protein